MCGWVDIDEVTGAYATDVILSLSYAKTAHGRLLPAVRRRRCSAGGRGMLLDALALTSRHLDSSPPSVPRTWRMSVCTSPAPNCSSPYSSGPSSWTISPCSRSRWTPAPTCCSTDLAERIRKRGLEVAVDYGFEKGLRIPMVVGLKNRPFALAVMTDDTGFMGIQSTRERHRVLMQRMQTLGLVGDDGMGAWARSSTRRGSRPYHRPAGRSVPGRAMSGSIRQRAVRRGAISAWYARATSCSTPTA